MFDHVGTFPSQSQTTVEKALSANPRSVEAFQAFRTNCVGCHMARFCTLADVARIYRLPLRQVLDRLTVSPKNHQRRSHENSQI